MVQNINTFPPLISDNSWDSVGNPHIKGIGTLISHTIERNEKDPFFYPNAGFSGYASDGSLYSDGTQVVSSGFVEKFQTNATYGGLGTIDLPDNRILVIQHDSKCYTINPYSLALEYTTVNFIQDFPVDPVDNVGGIGLVRTKKGDVIAIGGLLAGSVPIQSIHKFDYVTNSWSTFQSTIPVALDSFFIKLLPDDTILIYGGRIFNGVGYDPISESYLFNPTLDTIKTISLVFPEQNMSSLSVATSPTRYINWQISVSEFLVIVGDRIYFINTDTYTIAQSEYALPYVYDSGSVQGLEINDKFYVWSGIDTTSTFIPYVLIADKNKEFSRYNIVNKTAFSGLAAFGSELLIFAGMSGPTNVATGQIISFNTSSLSELVIGTMSVTIPIAAAYSIGTTYIACSDLYDTPVVGISYSGTQELEYASWYTEDPSIYRGMSKTFPHNTLVLVNDESISILDQDKRLDLWMTFVSGENHFIRNPFLSYAPDLKPTNVSYSRGVITVTYNSETVPGFFNLYIDFVKDECGYEYNMLQPAVITGSFTSPTGSTGLTYAPITYTFDLYTPGYAFGDHTITWKFNDDNVPHVTNDLTYIKTWTTTGARTATITVHNDVTGDSVSFTKTLTLSHPVTTVTITAPV